MDMQMKKIHSDQAPAAIGPYSQAIQAGPFLFTSGQIPLNAEGEMVSGDIRQQTHQVFRNLQAVLEAAGLSLNDAVKATVFLSNMDEFPIVNEIYAEYFGEHKPARSTVEVSRLPKNVGIEIELVAVHSNK